MWSEITGSHVNKLAAQEKPLPVSGGWDRDLQYLVFLQPLLQKLLSSLLEDGPAQLQGLKLVELALVQKDAKVLEQGGGLAWLGWDALEATDGVWGTQDTLRGERESNILQYNSPVEQFTTLCPKATFLSNVQHVCMCVNGCCGIWVFYLYVFLL